MSVCDTSPTYRDFDNVLFFPRGLNLAHITTLRKRGGTLSWDAQTCEITLQTGAEADSFSIINGYLPIYLNQSYKMSIYINAAFHPPLPGLLQLVGVGDSASGAFVGFNGTDFGMLLRRGGLQRQWVVKITAGATADGSLTLRLLDVDYILPVTAGLTAIQLMYMLGALPSLAEAGIRTYVCYDRITLRTQEAEAFAPAEQDAFLAGGTGATGTLEVSVSGAAAEQIWVSREQFNGSLNQNSEHMPLTNMNVFQFSFSRWSSACINLSMLNTTNDEIIPLHSLRPESTGFNTSAPYMPRIMIKKEADCLETGICKLRTSMASASSGTPATAVNKTWFNTHFGVDASITNTNSVIGVMSVPLLSGGVTNKVTAVISEIRVNAKSTLPLKILLTVNGQVDTVLLTQSHLPWSCMRHATPVTDVTVQKGLPAGTMFIQEGAGQQVLQPHQIWLAPGTNLTLSVSRSDGVQSIELIRCFVDIEVLWSEV